MLQNKKMYSATWADAFFASERPVKTPIRQVRPHITRNCYASQGGSGCVRTFHTAFTRHKAGGPVSRPYKVVLVESTKYAR